MTIRDAVLSDSAEIAQLTALLGYDADAEIVAERLARIINRHDQIVIVAVSEEKVAGWLQANVCDVLESGFRAEIVGLIVGENHRRLGVGRLLVESAEQWAIKMGAESVMVRSNVKRIESHSFYPALGYCASKTQTVYRKNLKEPPNRTIPPTSGNITQRADSRNTPSSSIAD
jgi:GNAT superfamily N-acetyltransferase